MFEIFSKRAQPFTSKLGKTHLSLKQFSVMLLLTYPMSSIAALPDQLTLNVGDIDDDGAEETVVLTKRSMRSATNHKLLTWDATHGYQEITPPEVRTYRGYVQDDISMRVNANIEPGNKTMNANLSDGRGLNYRLTELKVKLPKSSNKAKSKTKSNTTAQVSNGNKMVAFKADRVVPTKNGYIIPPHIMRRLDYALTVDNTYVEALDADIEAIVARTEQRMNDTDAFYARDMGLALEINWMVINLDENPAKWQNEWTNVHAENGAKFDVRGRFKKKGGAGAAGDLFKDARHSLGRPIAYSGGHGHELGHTLGGGHYSSWSDTLSGADSNLGAGTIERMIGNAQIATEQQSPEIHYSSPIAPYAMEDVATMLVNTSKDIDVLENDYDGNGDDIHVSYVDSKTKNGGSIKIVNGKVRYTPAKNWQGQDEFAYHVSDSSGISNRHGYVKVAVHNNGLASHIKFDETRGISIKDSGPFQAHGELGGKMAFNGKSSGGAVKGIIGGAMAKVDAKKGRAEFPGTGDPLDGDLSVSLWVKYQDKAPETEGVIIAKGGAVITKRFGNPRGGWDIGHTEDGRFRFEGNLTRDSEYTFNKPQFDLESSEQIKQNTWYHLVMVIDRSSQQLKAWVNGKPLTQTGFGTTIGQGAIHHSHYPLVIFNAMKGAYKVDTPITVDDVQIYHSVLSQQDVLALYQQPGNQIVSGNVSLVTE
ncbi:LamG-like jellyroll fold domain-containing protein [Thalassotalea fonticola]|uniref:LamG-like jellyroll fold domain-containing protein n=1 Tax=Thalassotalea fonticola TaxID=3065649 RepID=A0ABZ0GLC2_9GAMM|nr:LamG-like jellyroll fold domain-containing protein [Colwelliaceae bacterium S1-1]